MFSSFFNVLLVWAGLKINFLDSGPLDQIKDIAQVCEAAAASIDQIEDLDIAADNTHHTHTYNPGAISH